MVDTSTWMLDLVNACSRDRVASQTRAFSLNISALLLSLLLSVVVVLALVVLAVVLASVVVLLLLLLVLVVVAADSRVFVLCQYLPSKRTSEHRRASSFVLFAIAIVLGTHAVEVHT